MANNPEIKTQISIGGDKEYKAALKDINTELKLAKSHMSAMTSAYDASDKSIEALSTKQQALTEVQKAHDDKVSLLTQHLEELKANENSSADAIAAAQIALDNATTAANKNQLELDKVSTALEEASSSADSASGSLEGAGDAANSLGECKIDFGDDLSDAADQASDFSENADDAAGSADSMGTAASFLQGILSSITGGGMEEVGDAADDAADGLDTMSDSAEEAGEATEGAGDSAESASGGMDELASALSTIAGLTEAAVVLTAVGTAAGALAEAVTGAVSAGTQLATDAAGWADNYLTLATQTGISAQTLQEWQYASELVDVSVGTMTGSMTKLTKNMDKAASGNKDAVLAFESLGVAVVDADGHLRDNEDVFWDAIDALGKIENETERDALAMDLFGKSAKELNPLIEAGADRMRELGEEAERTGYVMSDEMLEAAGAFDDSLQTFKNGAQGLKNILGAHLAPLFTPFVNSANSAMQALGEAMKDGLTGDEVEGIISDFASDISVAIDDLFAKIDEFLPLGTEIFSAVVNTIATELPKLVEKIAPLLTSLITSIGSAISDNAAQLATAASSLISGLLTAITDALPGLLTAGALIVGSLASAVLEAAPGLIDTAASIVTTLAGYVGTALSGAEGFGGGSEIIGKIVTSITTALPQLASAAGSILTNLASYITTNLSTGLVVGGSIVSQLASSIIDSLGSLSLTAMSIIGSLASAITTNLPTFLTVGGSILNQVVTSITDNLANLLPAATDILTQIVTDIGTALPTSFTVGSEIISQLVTNITNALATLAPLAMTLIMKLSSTIVDYLPTFLTCGAEFLVQIAASIAENMPTLIGTAVSIISGLGTYLVALIPQLPGLLADVAKGIASALANIDYGALAASIISALGEAVVALSGVLGNVILTAIETALKAAIPEYEGPTDLTWRTDLEAQAGVELTVTPTDVVWNDSAAAAMVTDALQTVQQATAEGMSYEETVEYLLDIDYNIANEEAGEQAKEQVASILAQSFPDIDPEQIKNDIGVIEIPMPDVTFTSSETDVESDGVSEAVTAAVNNEIEGLRDEITPEAVPISTTGEISFETVSFAEGAVAEIEASGTTAGETVVTSMGTGITNKSADISTALATIAADAAKAFQQAITDAGLGEWFIGIVQTAIGGAGETSTTEGENIGKNAIDAAQEYVKDHAGDIGKYFAKGFADGITENESKITTAAKNAAKAAMQAANRELGIASPSRVMMETGKFFDLGFAEGIEDHTNSVLASARAMAAETAEAVTGYAAKVGDVAELEPTQGGGGVVYNVTVPYSGQYTRREASRFSSLLMSEMQAEAFAVGG